MSGYWTLGVSDQVSGWKPIQCCAKGPVYLQIPPAGVSYVCLPLLCVCKRGQADQKSKLSFFFLAEIWATTRSTLWLTHPLLTWASSPLCKPWPNSDQRARMDFIFIFYRNTLTFAESWATTPCVVSPKWPSVDCTRSDYCEHIFRFKMCACVSVLLCWSILNTNSMYLSNIIGFFSFYHAIEMFLCCLWILRRCSKQQHS